METWFLWTLVHSLWIGIISAVTAGLIILCTRRSSAQLRYILFCAALSLFVISTVAMGVYQYSNVPEGISVPGAPLLADARLEAVTLTETTQVFPGRDLTAGLNTFINQYSSWILALWMVCFLWKIFNLAGGLFYLHKLRYKTFSDTPAEWTDKVASFAARLGIKSKVMICQSQKVTIPLTIGFLKPVIFLPAGLLLQLPPAYIDSIIWHELAHIRRHDYLVNMLQKGLETVFFFNPAVIWISQLIRAEREACCDDIVLANVPHKGTYLDALLSFQEPGPAHGKLAMALSWQQNDLRNRLYRITGMGNQKLSLKEGILLLTGIVFLSAVSAMAPATNKTPEIMAAKEQTRAQSEQLVTVQSNDFTIKARQGTRKLPPAPRQLRPVGGEATFLAEEKTEEMNLVTDTTDWKKYKISKQNKADLDNKINNQKSAKMEPFDNSRISKEVQQVKTVAQALVSEGIVANVASIDWFGLSETELVVNGQKQSAALHEKLKMQTQVSPGHGLYYGPVKMIGQGFFLDKQDLLKL